MERKMEHMLVWGATFKMSALTEAREKMVRSMIARSEDIALVLTEIDGEECFVLGRKIVKTEGGVFKPVEIPPPKSQYNAMNAVMFASLGFEPEEALATGLIPVTMEHGYEHF